MIRKNKKKKVDDNNEAAEEQDVNVQAEDSVAEGGDKAEGGGDEVVEKDPETELAELRDRLQRTTAEFMNFRKQTEKRQKDTRLFIRRDVFEQILPIVDNFGAAMKALDQGQDAANVLIGVKMIQEMLEKLLVDNGIKPIEAKDGVFDPNFHEAVSREISEEIEPNIVVSEIAKGYTMGDLVLRHARVVVSAAPEAEAEAEAEELPAETADEDQNSKAE